MRLTRLRVVNEVRRTADSRTGESGPSLPGARSIAGAEAHGVGGDGNVWKCVLGEPRIPDPGAEGAGQESESIRLKREGPPVWLFVPKAFEKSALKATARCGQARPNLPLSHYAGH